MGEKLNYGEIYICIILNYINKIKIVGYNKFLDCGVMICNGIFFRDFLVKNLGMILVFSGFLFNIRNKMVVNVVGVRCFDFGN